MDKLDKVIKAWECCNPLNRRCFECPYDADCFHDSFDRVAIADMVKLLKEQQAEIDRLKNDKANVIKLLEKEREENKPGSDYAIRPMRASDINEQHKGMYYAFSFAINALIEKGR